MTFAQETSINHHTESPMEEAKRKTTKHLTKRHGKRNKRDGIHQERDGENGHRQKTVAFLGRWSIFPNEQTGISKLSHTAVISSL